MNIDTYSPNGFDDGAAMLLPSVTPPFQRKIPLYFHIESVLRQKILTGQFPPNGRIPTEKEMVAQFGVSQITVRTALANLESEGLILRKRGKGTFVAPTVPLRKQVIVTRDVQSFILDSKRYEVKALGIEARRIQETRSARDLGAFFHLGDGEIVSLIGRVRLLAGRPVSFVENFCLPDVAKHLTLRELSEEPLQTILQRKIGLRVGRSEAYLESVPADPDVAEILRVHVSAPLFLLQGYLRFASGEPFELVNLFMRPDCFKYKIEMPQE